MNINEIVEKNKIGLVICIIGCLIFFVASFFGHNYVWEDNLILSSVFSLVATLALFFLSLFLIKYKNDPSRKGITIPEIILLTAYALIAIVSSLFVMHFINTEFAFKENIKKMGLQKIEILHNISKEYIAQTEIATSKQKTECETLVKKYVASKSKNASSRNQLISDYGFTFGTVADEASLMARCASFKKSKDNAYNKPILNLRSSKEKDMLNIKQVFSSYARRKVPEALKWVDEWTKSDMKILKASYPDFKYTLPDYTNVPQLNNVGETLRHPSAQNGVALGFLLLIHLMILGWYLFRSGRKLGGFLDEKYHYK